MSALRNRGIRFAYLNSYSHKSAVNHRKKTSTLMTLEMITLNWKIAPPGSVIVDTDLVVEEEELEEEDRFKTITRIIEGVGALTGDEEAPMILIEIEEDLIVGVEAMTIHTGIEGNLIGDEDRIRNKIGEELGQVFEEVPIKNKPTVRSFNFLVQHLYTTKLLFLIDPSRNN